MQDGAVASVGSRDDALANGRGLLTADPRGAAEQARAILAVDAQDGDALRLLGAALRRLGNDQDAEAAEREAITASTHNPILVDAARAITGERLREAENLLRPYLDRKPDDAAAVRMLAEIAARTGADAQAEALLRRALALAPSYTSARSRLAKLLNQQNRTAEALVVLDELLGREPENARARSSKAAVLGRIGEYREAIRIHEELLEGRPDSAPLWMAYGHLLKTVGRADDSVAAYRAAIGVDQGFGEAWWSLANLKSVRLDSSDVAAMTAALDQAGLDDTNRLHLHFALGKAFEDAASFERSFSHYVEGNRLRRAALAYDPDVVSHHVRRSRALFTRDFLARRDALGCPAPDPVFILGMPRAGSTLIEQILSSHSQIEGTSELPHLPTLAQRVGVAEWQSDEAAFAAIATAAPEQLKALGEDYLRSARLHRKTDRPFFIDKLPNNWANIGLIQLILPNAKIIDARRHPLGCCLSNFKQHFARGQAFTYSLDELGRYYRDYVTLLAHFDAVRPGRIHRVLHERMVEDPEREIRNLLAYLELPFEPSCLRFYENDRAVRTPSAEQVRRPINREGVDRWREYEPWLGPLKTALGPVLDLYPDASAE